MRVAVLVDAGKITRWQKRALDNLTVAEIVLVLSCQNTRSKKKLWKNLLYYILNLAAIKNSETRRRRFEAQTADWVDFDSTYSGAWQELPQDVVALIVSAQVDVVVKFGMSLLVVPEEKELPVPIVSYHHGDPEKYRGRPAGFYEMLADEDYVGLMVQRITNELDAGIVLAYGEARVIPHSYRKTLVGAYAKSSYLLEPALRRLHEAEPSLREPTGRNYRLPANSVVLRFLLRMGWSLTQRALYGGFVEKGWRVSTSASTTVEDFLDGHQPDDVRTPPLEKGFAFYADPFIADGGRLIVEAVPKSSGAGRLMLLDTEGAKTLTQEGQHFSYPSVIHDANRILILPETAGWRSPHIYPLEAGGLGDSIPLGFPEHARVLDPTHLEHEGHHYIFGSKRGIDNVLFLWYSHELLGPYSEHPWNPICISPRGARMAGAILHLGERTLRLGQNGCRGYGNGIFVREITELSPYRYSERLVGKLRLSNKKGPHTVNTAEGLIVWDWYEERISPVAWYRRARRT